MSSSELEVQKAADCQQEAKVPASVEITGSKQPEEDTNARTKAELDFAAAEQYKNQGNEMLKSKYLWQSHRPVMTTISVLRAIHSVSALYQCHLQHNLKTMANFGCV